MAAFTVIDHDELSGAATSWTSTAIPSTYEHLYLMVSARTDQVAVYAAQLIQFNGDTGTNYSSTTVYGHPGLGVNTTRYTGQVGIAYPMVTGASVAAEDFGVIMMWIPGYANTAHFKPTHSQSNAPEMATTGWQARMTSGLWSSTAAITSVTVDARGSNYDQYSTFTLYGVTA